MPSAELTVVLEHLRLMARIQESAPGGAGIAVLRSMTEMYACAHPSCSDLRTTVTPTHVADRRAEWHTTPSGDNGHRLLYIHGGGWMAGSLGSCRGLVSNITAATGGASLTLDYRLAPEHRFPAALDDTIAAIRWLRDNGPDGPSSAKSIAIAGDSAGGNIALACLLALRDAGEPLPGCAAVISPLTDFSGTGESRTTRRDVDPVIPADGVSRVGAIYAGRGVDILTPLVSPLYGDLTGLPPLLIHVGDAEVMLSDSTMFATKAEQAGVPVTLEVWDHMPHVFHYFAPFLPEANQAIDGLARFLSRGTSKGE